MAMNPTGNACRDAPQIPPEEVYGRQGEVKTRTSQKWMPLDRSLAEKLSQPLRFASPPNIENWVFANPKTGKPIPTAPTNNLLILL